MINEMNNTPITSALVSGLKVIDRQKAIKFTLYNRVVLPYDGFVFYVNSNAINNGSTFNTWSLNSKMIAERNTAKSIEVEGSLHYNSIREQDSDKNYDRNELMFTTPYEILEFNQAQDNSLYIAEYDGMQFSFNSRLSSYSASGLYEYRGQAVPAYLRSQLIESKRDLSKLHVTSNCMSLIMAFALNKELPVYPAYLAKANDKRFVTTEVTSTECLAAYPFLDRDGTRTQLTRDNVKVCFYGFENDAALDFVFDFVNMALEDDDYGIANIPTVSDAREPDSELRILSQKKESVIVVNYYQKRVQELTRKLILTAPFIISII